MYFKKYLTVYYSPKQIMQIMPETKVKYIQKKKNLVSDI